MPMMDLTLPQGTLEPEQRTALVDELTAALLRAERAPDTEFFRSITWAYVHELPAQDMHVGGRPTSQPVVRLEVTTPEGALSDRRRAEMVADATRLISEATGIPGDDPRRVWVMCREVAEGSWGAGGQVVRFQELRDAAQAEQAEAAHA